MKNQLVLIEDKQRGHISAGDWFAKNFAMAVAYFIFAKIAGVVAIPPGFATAVWPAAGISFFSLFFWGNFLWPGVILGSAIFNYMISSSVGGANENFYNILLSLLIGSGAALQALVGSNLSHNIIKKSEDILQEKNVIFILIFAGPISCLLSATTGVGMLLAFSKISATQFMSSWITWYIGDSIGVLVFAPACLILLTNFYSSKWNKKITAILPLLTAFTVSLTVYLLVLRVEKRQATERFNQSTNQLVTNFNIHFQDNLKILRFLESFFQSSDSVDKEEFKTFTQSLFNWSGGIYALAWAPRVALSDLATFKSEVKKTDPNFRIVERNELGEFTDVAQRSFYFPVRYAEPTYEGRGAAIGFDLASQIDRRLAILHSIDRGNIVATAPVKLVSDLENKSGFVMFMPVFKPTTKKFENFKGVYIAAVRFEDVIQLTDTSILDLFDEFTISDITEVNNPQVVYKKTLRKSEINKQDGLFREQSISFAERMYLVRTFVSNEKLYSTITWPLWLSLTFGMVFTGLLGAFVLIIIGRSRQLEIEVSKATEEVHFQRLRAEEINRFKSLGIMAGGVAHEINNPLMIISGNATVLTKILEKEGVTNSRAYESLYKINKTVERISRIVKGLLTLSRDSSQDPIERISIAKVIDLGMLLLSEKYKAYGITLRYSGDMDVELDCKVAQLSQVFTVVLQNSMESIRQLANPWVEVRAHDDGADLVVEVIDSGLGLSKEIQEKLFTPFFTTKDVGEGTGLGLSIARGVIESHGGDIRYEPQFPNTKFIIKIPKRQGKVLKFK